MKNLEPIDLSKSNAYWLVLNFFVLFFTVLERKGFYCSAN